MDAVANPTDDEPTAGHGPSRKAAGCGSITAGLISSSTGMTQYGAASLLAALFAACA
jgi:hypothetical protein